MQKSDQGDGAGKRGAGDRQARLAAKLRQNLVRRKNKVRGSAAAAAMQLDSSASRTGDAASDESDGA